MGAALKEVVLMTYEEYLELEESSHERWGWLDGEVWCMSGGTLRHARMISRLHRVVGNQLDGSGCAAYSAAARFRVRDASFACHPDLAVICGEPETASDDVHAYVNPVLVIEVLSRNTEGADRGFKFRCGAQADSLRHYVLVEQREPRIEYFERRDDGSWLMRSYGPGAKLVIDHPAIELDVDRIFESLPPLPQGY